MPSIQASRERVRDLNEILSKKIDEKQAAGKNWTRNQQIELDTLQDEFDRHYDYVKAIDRHGVSPESDAAAARIGPLDDGYGPGISHNGFQGSTGPGPGIGAFGGGGSGDEPLVFRANSAAALKDLRAHFAPPHARMSASAQGAISLSGFVNAIANGGRTKSAAIQAALTEGTDSAGGFTVPSIVMPGIMEALAPASSLLKAGAGVTFPTIGAKSYNYAGINTIPVPGFRSENGAVAESDPTFRNVQATPRSLAFMFKVSRELLADSQNLEGALRTVIGQAFAKEIDRAGLRGTGTAPEPRGILNTVGIQAVTNGANGASLATTKYANIMSGIQAIAQADAPATTAAIMSPRSRMTLAGLVDTTGQPLRAPPLASDLNLIVTSQIPNNLTVGTSTDCTEIYVGDFSKVIFVMRENPSIQLADQLYAATGQVAFICHARVDVIVEYPAALSVITGVRA